MPVNPGIHYMKAEAEFQKAATVQEKLKALKLMLATVPRHKGSEKLQLEIKRRIAKYKVLAEKEQKQRKGVQQFAIKKEGAATVVLVGTTNSGKSTLLAHLTNAKPEIAAYPFTTKKPEVGILDYHGIKIQIVEIPALVKNFEETVKGPSFLSIIRTADLIIVLCKTPEEYTLLEQELANIPVKRIIFTNQPNLHDEIWQNLNLVKIFTKMPGKKPSYPPVALKKGSSIKDLASHVHKDFIRKFKFARVWGKSVKFDSQKVGLDHKLADDDVVELHLK